MKKVTEVSRIVKRTDYYCDVCGLLMDSLDLKICDVCGKHLCKNCTARSDEEFDEESPSFYCRRCWNIGDLYRGDIEEAKNKCRDTVRRLETEWKKSATEEE